MKMPGFTAEASLYKTSEHYCMGGTLSKAALGTELVSAQLARPPYPLLGIGTLMVSDVCIGLCSGSCAMACIGACVWCPVCSACNECVDKCMGMCTAHC